ncbi:hypothetical protein CPB97_004964, partial [Podila verticillata]
QWAAINAVSNAQMFPLQHAQQPVVTLTETTKIDPIFLPQAAAIAIQRLAQQVPTTNTMIIYSDGSMIQAHTPKVSMAFGVVDSDSNINLSVTGCTDGHASSTKAELI